MCATDEAGEQEATGFTPDRPFYAFAELKNAPDATKVKTTWTAVEGEGADPNAVIETATGSSPVYFTLTNDGVGRYRVEPPRAA